MTGSDSGRPPVPTHQDLVAELRTLREKGLIRLRRLTLLALTDAAHLAGTDPAVAGVSTAVESLLRSAVAAMGDEEPGLASQYLFGLVQGTIGRSPTDLRERAAQVYDRSPETFRKERERLLIDRIADEILLLCLKRQRVAEPDGLHDRLADQGEDEPQSQLSGPVPVAAAERGVGDGSLLQVRHQVAHDLDRILRDLDQDERIHQEGTFGPYFILVDGAGTTAPVTVHLGPVELLRGIDVITTSANVYLDPSRTYAATLAGRIRSAAAVRDAAGAIVRDEVAEDLACWAGKHAMAGRSVPPGTVVATSPGRLVERGVRRLYHAAVAEPLPTSNGYTVSGEAISRAVLQCFRLARSERDGYDPPLRAISLPLFGTGRAGLEPRTSFSWLWPALVAELRVNPGWHIHFSTWRPVETSEVLSGLQRYLERY